MAAQETHLKENNTEHITTTDRKGHYTIYYSVKKGNHQAGAGIVVKRNSKVSFLLISERVCMCTLEIAKPSRKITMICTYAPTMPTSEKQPQIHKALCNQLESLINSVSRRNALVVAGDFNPKTYSSHGIYPNNMERSGKRHINSNGGDLLELACRHDLFSPHTTFQHIISHIITWENPHRNFHHKDGIPRINPFRN